MRNGFVKFAVAALVLALVPSLASATITFTASGATTTFQQTLNNPCVLGDESCKEPANFFYDDNSGTPGGGNGSTYDLFSGVYKATGSVVAGGNIIPTSFTIGVDENIAAGQSAEQLVFFKTYLCGAGSSVTTANNSGATTPPASCVSPVLDAANSYTPASPTTIPNIHNGNGFSDFILQGFSLNANSFYLFEAKVSSDSDGMEEFFIIPAGTPFVTPEPGTLVMFGTGLIGLAGVLRRRLTR